MSQQHEGREGNEGQGQDRGGFKPTWRFAAEFYDEATGVAVQVNKTNHPVPQYSLKTGRYKGEPETGQFLPFIGARVTRDNIFSGILECDNLDALVAKIVEAKEWIEADLAHCCDEAQQRAEAREQRAANRDKPETRKTGKTARKKGVKQEPAGEQPAAG